MLADFPIPLPLRGVSLSSEGSAGEEADGWVKKRKGHGRAAKGVSGGLDDPKAISVEKGSQFVVAGQVDMLSSQIVSDLIVRNGVELIQPEEEVCQP